MTVKGFDASEKLAVVATGDEDLYVRANSSLQDGEGSRCKLILLELSNLVLAVSASQRGTDERLTARVCGRSDMARGLNVRELIARLAQKLPDTCQ